ncbi:hypothetical protein NQ314_001793 [Rhamnusium bicolor]|uniref:Reverse transcriptase domain-containing protein n=1 Tax=Rhamnusium bicolor TaxID=1586634 RepID=A0AAV8ZRS9_9CUCU|nr:hypothetical protein NQ314_001793 [Rhamnusium bicolor]
MFMVYAKFSDLALESTPVKLKTYNGQVILPVGQITAEVEINNVVKSCTIVIVKNAGKILLGRDILKIFGLRMAPNLHENVNSLGSSLDELLLEFQDLFKRELGKYTGKKIRLEVEPNVRPIFHKPRPVHFAFKDKVATELSKLECTGCIEKVGNSAWGTPLVPVMKADGKSVRVCANYKITVNRYLRDVNHHLPRIDKLFAALQGGKKFS